MACPRESGGGVRWRFAARVSERARESERERVSPGMEKLGRAKRIFFCADFAVKKKNQVTNGVRLFSNS